MCAARNLTLNLSFAEPRNMGPTNLLQMLDMVFPRYFASSIIVLEGIQLMISRLLLYEEE